MGKHVLEVAGEFLMGTLLTMVVSNHVEHKSIIVHWLVAMTPKSSSAAVMIMTERSALVVAAVHVTCIVHKQDMC